MRFHVLTLFPDMIINGMNTSITGRAMERGLIGLDAVDIRDYADNKHMRVDDYPYGGGISLQEGRVGESFTAHRPPSGKGKETYAVSQHLSVCFIYRDIVRLRGGQSDNPVGKRETDICFKLAGMDFLVFCAHWCGMYDFAFY